MKDPELVEERKALEESIEHIQRALGDGDDAGLLEALDELEIELGLLFQTHGDKI
jgi:hypothetical protein